MTAILETPRLGLREMVHSDLDFVAEMLADAEVMRYYPKTYTRDDAQGWLDKQIRRYAEHGHGLWLVERRDSAEPVGQVGLIRQLVDGNPHEEIGYLIHRPYWRQGYATEAARGVRDYAFGTLRLPRVISLIRPENLPSQGVARRLGMEKVAQTIFNGLPHCIFAMDNSRTHVS